MISPAFAQNGDSAKPAPKPKFNAYNPQADAAKDIQAAVAEAAKSDRRVLVEVGGNWCIWCRYIEEFFASHPDIREFRDKNYVMVRVSYSEENKNEAVLSKYPKIPGYPHFFVLDSDGKLIHSQDTSKLEEGRGYNADSMKHFLEDWAPVKKS